MNMCTSLIKVALMDNLIWFDDYSSILLVLFILSWAFNTKISIFCNIGKIFKMSKNCKPKFVFLKPNYNVFPSDYLRRFMLLLTSLVLEWPEENYCVLSELKGRDQCSYGTWGSGWFCLVPVSIVPPSCTGLFVVAYVLLDTVKKLSGNGFILWSEQYFVIYDSVNGKKSIKCIKSLSIIWEDMKEIGVEG